MAQNENTDPVTSNTDEPSEDAGGAESIKQQIEELRDDLEKKKQVIHVLEEENEFLKKQIEDKDVRISDLKESVLNLELMLNKAQKSDKAPSEEKEKDKKLDYFIP